jgi:hypothetical protein
LSNIASINTNLAYAVLWIELLYYFPRDPDIYLPIKFLILGPRIPSHYITNITADKITISVFPRGVKQQLDLRFSNWTKTWPMKLSIIETDKRDRPFKGIERVAFYTTIELQRGLAIRSEYS